MFADQDRSLESEFYRMNIEVFSQFLKKFDRGKTIFFPGDPAERVYFLLKGVVKLSRVYETGDEHTVAFLRENNVFGVLSLLTEFSSDRVYHAVAFTPLTILSFPNKKIELAIKEMPDLSMLLLRGLSLRILQTERMIETLAHRDMGSRLVSFLLILCHDFGVQNENGVTIDLRLFHQAIAETIGSTRVTVTRLMG